jgi:hypothetical protein
MAKVAFIGLGNMGGPMAINLVKAGHAVTAFDLSADAQKVRLWPLLLVPLWQVPILLSLCCQLASMFWGCI